jgi:hypothetical protein
MLTRGVRRLALGATIKIAAFPLAAGMILQYALPSIMPP